MAELEDLRQTIIEGDYKRAGELTRVVLDQDAGPFDVLSQGLQPGMVKVGREFKEGERKAPQWRKE